MNKTYSYQPASSLRRWAQKLVLPAVLGLALTAAIAPAHAQEASWGNTTVFGGAQMTFFGNHEFKTGGAGTQVGLIGTERTSGAGYGKVTYSANTLVVTGANDANHVDGYVGKLGTGLFVYPVGDNGFYGPFAATGDGTTGAYFHADANSAVTSNLAGGNYIALPSGAPFNTTLKAADVTTVSTVEYWDIDGAAISKITLTWDAGSAVGTLTGSDLTKLGIVGWNGTEWVKIASTVDVTSVLTGASALGAGSITTDAAIIPNAYTAYTLASVLGPLPDLTPTTDISSFTFATAGTSRDFIVNLYEINNVATSGQIRFRLTKLSSYNITYPLTSGTSNVSGNIANENGNWDFAETAAFITITSKAGIIIPANGQAKIGFNITRKPNIPAGNAQNITPTIIGGSGGEMNTTNNQVVTTVTAN